MSIKLAMNRFWVVSKSLNCAVTFILSTRHHTTSVNTRNTALENATFSITALNAKCGYDWYDYAEYVYALCHYTESHYAQHHLC
jgi:hypothetical protein